MRRRRILVVEDERKTHEMVRLYLERQGYDISSAYDGAEAMRMIEEGRYDLVVLDLMLPNVDGMAICRSLRQGSETAVIMLTARSTEEDKLRGLDVGADDYLTKPFSPRELVARVKAVLRRTSIDEIGGLEELSHEDISINVPRREVVVGEVEIRVTPTEFRLLACFLRSPGRVFTREELVRQVLGSDGEALDRTIDAHVMNLRKKIGQDRIVTVFGVGYRLAES